MSLYVVPGRSGSRNTVGGTPKTLFGLIMLTVTVEGEDGMPDIVRRVDDD